jgi:hypothetical protein
MVTVVVVFVVVVVKTVVVVDPSADNELEAWLAETLGEEILKEAPEVETELEETGGLVLLTLFWKNRKEPELEARKAKTHDSRYQNQQNNE